MIYMLFIPKINLNFYHFYTLLILLRFLVLALVVAQHIMHPVKRDTNDSRPFRAVPKFFASV